MRRLALVVLLLALTRTAVAAPIVQPVDAPEAGTEPFATAATCALAPGSLAAVSFIWTPPESLVAFAWRIPAASCAACASSGMITPRSVTFRMRWLKACSAQARVSIVGSKQGPNCLIPDTTQVLSGPFTQTIAGTGNATAFHTIDFSGDACVPATAFVLLRFTGLGSCGAGGTLPGLAASSAACVPCTQFVEAANIFPAWSEWCGDVGASNATWLSLAADCCTPVPAREQSWGALKTLYR